tara:strand:- start:1081 stop:1269 length:189 start_codon:yes stop_codon:yes gene_type:complete
MPEESINSLEENLQMLKDNPPVEPNEDELEDFQYESAKASYDRALETWKENIKNLEEQLLVE